MQSRHYWIIFLIIVLVGMSAYILINRGYFPIAVVNSAIITQRQYEKNLSAIYQYSDELEKVYQAPDVPSAGNKKVELKRIVLQEIVENTIIHQDVKRRLGSSFDDIVDNKIKDLSGSEDLKKAASTLYGLTLADFIDLFIKPAAERELLDGKLLLEKTTFDDWFKEAKKNASVTLLVSGFFWNGDGVEVK